MRTTPRSWPAGLAALTLLAGCESSFDVDFVAGPAPEDSTVTVRVEGVDLRQIDGDIEEVRRNDIGEFISQAGAEDDANELVTNAKIDNGEYAGVRLILADDAGTLEVEGDPDEPIEPTDAADTRDTEVAFDFDDGDDGNDIRIVVALDLVLSLSQDQDTGEVTLDPVIRAMDSEDAASVGGTIPASRFDDGACGEGTARVYAFVGSDVEPDERDGNGVEPLAVADIVRTDSNSAGQYQFRFMPPDDYTLAFTCESEFENGLEPADDEDIDFFEGADIRLDPGEDLTVDFDA
ncbi:MAG: carboxypeptidase-like regulatory domain-containing protein [Panacagrimonas sp.]